MHTARFSKHDARQASGPVGRVLGLRVCLIGTIVLAGTLAAATSHAQTIDPEILSVLNDMVGQKHNFKTDKLHGMGFDGLAAVLDELLPDTADPERVDVPADVTAQLVEQLGSENFRVRETASGKLRDFGPGIRAALIEAAGNPDAEISWRASRILRAWDFTKTEDKSRYYPAFCAYASGIHDDQRLEELARRTVMAFQVGMPAGGRRNILRQCVTTIATSGKPVHTDRLGPLLEHSDVQVAVLVTQAVGMAVNRGSCPGVFLDALKAEREAVVIAAIPYTANCAEGPYKSDVKERLIDIFQNGSKTQKIRATYPLMYAFGYTRARSFLLEEVTNGDRGGKTLALSYLGNSSNQGTPADEKLLKALSPLLKPATDRYVRRAAARALGVYSGEEVVERLIPLLADEYSSIPRDVKRKLLKQPDKKMLRKQLAAAAEQHADKKVRQAAAELLKALDGQKK